jgi:hypothetical protein
MGKRFVNTSPKTSGCQIKILGKPVRIAKIKKNDIKNQQEYTGIGENVKWCKQSGYFLKK